jgi:trimeric autotransporter adhesin
MEVNCGLYVPKPSTAAANTSTETTAMDKEAIVQGPADDMTYRSFLRHPASLASLSIGTVYPGITAMQAIASSAAATFASASTSNARQLYLPQPRHASLVAAEKKFQNQRQAAAGRSASASSASSAMDDTDDVDIEATAETTTAAAAEVDSSASATAVGSAYASGFDTAYLENPSAQVIDRGYYSATGSGFQLHDSNASSAAERQKKSSSSSSLLSSPSQPLSSKSTASASWKRTMKANRVPSPLPSQSSAVSSEQDLPIDNLSRIPQDRLPPSKKDHSRLLTATATATASSAARPTSASPTPSTASGTSAAVGAKAVPAMHRAASTSSYAAVNHATAKTSLTGRSSSSHLLHLASLQSSVARSSASSTAAAAALGQRAMIFGSSAASSAKPSAGAAASTANTMIDAAYVYTPPDATIFLPPGSTLPATTTGAKASSQIRGAKKSSSFPSAGLQKASSTNPVAAASIYKSSLTASSSGALAAYQTQGSFPNSLASAGGAAAYNREILGTRAIAGPASGTGSTAISRVKSSNHASGTAIYRAPVAKAAASTASFAVLDAKKAAKQSTAKALGSGAIGGASSTAAGATDQSESKKRPISAVLATTAAESAAGEASGDPEAKRPHVQAMVVSQPQADSQTSAPGADAPTANE